MIWLKVEDAYFYNSESEYLLLREKIAFSNRELSIYLDSKVKEGKITFALVFDKMDAKDIFHHKEKKDFVIISPFSPKEIGIETSFFGVFRVENTEGILTSSELLVGLEKQKEAFNAGRKFILDDIGNITPIYKTFEDYLKSK